MASLNNSSNTTTPKPTLPTRQGWFRRLWNDVVFVIKRDNKWWLTPLIVVLMLLMLLTVLAATMGPLAPFIYPLL
jgi:hypothetical protein